MDRLTTRRDYCVKEMVETEQNYVKALGMICEVSTEEIVVWGVGGGGSPNFVKFEWV